MEYCTLFSHIKVQSETRNLGWQVSVEQLTAAITVVVLLLKSEFRRNHKAIFKLIFRLEIEIIHFG